MASAAQSLCFPASDERIVGIDASGFDRSHASKHYTKRAKLTIQQLKVTLLVDTRVNAILDLHVTTRKHDMQIAPSLIKRNINDVAILLGDKGYDDQEIRTLAREKEVLPWTGVPPRRIVRPWTGHPVVRLEQIDGRYPRLSKFILTQTSY